MAQPLAYAASFGKIDEFDPDTDNWDIYCERLDQCFTARNIDENATDLKRAIMLSEMGKKGSSEMCVRPQNPVIRRSPN